MIRFKHFINLSESSVLKEAALFASGKHSDRHYYKYVHGREVEATGNTSTPTHVTSKAIKTHNVERDTPVFIHRYDRRDTPIINGVRHVRVSTTGKKQDSFLIPQHALVKPKPGYNEEHAVAHLWNRLGETGHHEHRKSVESMHNMIQEARNNKDHPLSFENASNEGFYHKSKNLAGSREAYYKQLEAAAHTVSTIANHPDARKHKNSVAEVVGGKKYEVTGESYLKHGQSHSVTGKTDIILRNKNPEKDIKITLKKEKGSQLTSSAPEEFRGMVEHAKNKLGITGNVANEIDKHADEIERAQNSRDVSQISSVNQALKHILKHKGFGAALSREAITGEHKFGGGDAVPNYVASYGRGSEMHHVDKIDYESLRAPEAAAGKWGPESVLAIRQRQRGNIPVKG